MPILSSKYTWILALALPVIATTSCSAGRGDESVDTQGDDPLSAVENQPHKALCADAPAGYARCHARVRVTPQGTVKVFAAPSGLTPADLQSAYALPTSGGSGMTI